MNFILVIAVLILDQLSKVLALKYLLPIGDIPIITNIFHLTYVENRGAAFGLFQNQKIFFIITTLMVLGFMYYFTRTNKINTAMSFALSLVAGGAIGNLIDRVRLGFVVDYFHIVDRFPVFNIADSAVVVGTIVICFFIFKDDILAQKEG